MHDDYDPVTVSKCKSCNRKLVGADKLLKAKQILDELATTQQVITLQNPAMPQQLIRLSSTRDAATDTISYWIQYPVLDVHLQMALCSSQDLPITPSEMEQAVQRHAILYEQLQKIVKDGKVTASCEQVDPIFMEIAIKTLVSQGYDKIVIEPQEE